MDSVRGLSTFLTYLASHPSPDQALAACLRGPLARFDTEFGSIHLPDDERTLVMVGMCGMSAAEADRYRTIPLGVDIPLSRSYLNVELIQAQPTDLALEFPTLVALDSEILDGLELRGHGGTLFIVPIIRGGYPVGTLGFKCRGVVTLSPWQVQFLLALGAALALWLADPESKIDMPRMTRWDSADEAWSLTPRQSSILLLAAAGKSGPAIAGALGFSLSTIKQEMHRITRGLRVESRDQAIAKADKLGLLTGSHERPSQVRAARNALREHTTFAPADEYSVS